MTEEQRKKKASKWMDWYWNHGGRERILPQRRRQNWLSKKEIARLDGI